MRRQFKGDRLSQGEHLHNSVAKADSHSGEQSMEQNIASTEDLGYCNQGGGGNSGRGRRAPLEALGVTAETGGQEGCADT